MPNLPIPFWNRFSRVFGIPWRTERLRAVEMNRSPHLPNTCSMHTLDNLWNGNKTYFQPSSSDDKQFSHLQ
jgi:hypothetical protein